MTRQHAYRLAEEEKGTVVPLYRQPPQPRGWLTPKDREWLTFIYENVCISHEADEWIKSFLARSTPPEVVLPDVLFRKLSVEERAEVVAAFAAAGVAVKEVVRE
jgi:hypothetical protein